MDQEPASAAKIVTELLQHATVASLGTTSPTGDPFVSLVTVAKSGNRSIAMLLSDLAAHTKNLGSHRKASLLLIDSVDQASDPLSVARVSLVGRTERLSRQQDDSVRESFLAKHPSAAMYAGFGDFAFHVLEIESAHLVAGFGRIETIGGDQL